MQIISTIAMISINETLIIQLISFLIFLFIINRIMIQPLRSVSREREAHIQKIELDTVAAEKKVEQVVKQTMARGGIVVVPPTRFEKKSRNPANSKPTKSSASHSGKQKTYRRRITDRFRQWLKKSESRSGKKPKHSRLA